MLSQLNTFILVKELFFFSAFEFSVASLESTSDFQKSKHCLSSQCSILIKFILTFVPRRKNNLRAYLHTRIQTSRSAWASLFPQRLTPPDSSTRTLQWTCFEFWGRTFEHVNVSVSRCGSPPVARFSSNFYRRRVILSRWRQYLIKTWGVLPWSTCR